METGLATGWCDRRAERERTLLLVLSGEAGLADGSSLLEGGGHSPKGAGDPCPKAEDIPGPLFNSAQQDRLGLPRTADPSVGGDEHHMPSTWDGLGGRKHLPHLTNGGACPPPT